MSARSPWDPLRLASGAVLRNRFVLAPMTTDASHPEGTVSRDELDYIKRRCANEFGASITSCAYVHPDGRAWRGIGAAEDAHLDSLREVAAAFQSGGGVAILQLYDGGRLADPSLVPAARIRAPSAVSSARPGAPKPRPLSSHEVTDLIDAFAHAAAMGKAAGFDGVELHGANHYLIHQFFSPRANQRADRWGGTATNRRRFPLQVAAAVRAKLGDDAVFGFRVNPFESEPGGFTLDDAADLCHALCDEGVDYVHISMDDFRKNAPMREDRDWTSEAGSIAGRNPIRVLADAVGGRSAIVASGGVRSLDDAQAALDAGADLVAVARAALIDPEWLRKIKAGDQEMVRRAIPASPNQIESELTIPSRMVSYLLSRPGWIPREPLSPTK